MYLTSPLLRSWAVSYPDKTDHYVVVSCRDTVLTTCGRTLKTGNGFIIPPPEDDFRATGLRYYT